MLDTAIYKQLQYNKIDYRVKPDNDTRYIFLEIDSNILFLFFFHFNDKNIFGKIFLWIYSSNKQIVFTSL